MERDETKSGELQSLTAFKDDRAFNNGANAADSAHDTLEHAEKQRQISSGPHETQRQIGMHNNQDDLDSPRIASMVHRSESSDEDIELLVKQEQERRPKQLTRTQSFGLFLLMLYMGSQLTLPFALAVFIVRDIYKDEGSNEQKIAQLTGFLAASQSCARSLTSLPWGIISDKIGRKAVMLMGILASITSLLCFGSSTTYLGAVLSRFLPSLLVGTAVAIKSMMGDACDQTGQAKAMTIFSLGHGIGSIIGPILGGLLSNPCDKVHLPGCEAGGLFERRPFFLPCLVISGLGLVAFLSSCLLLPETHEDVVNQPGGFLGNLFRVVTFQKRMYTSLEAEEHREDAVGKMDLEMGALKAKDRRDLVGDKIDEQRACKSSSQDAQAVAEFKWYRDPKIRTSLIGAGIIALIFNFVDELSPIFISAPIDRGGLDMTLEQFTWPLACSGLALAIFAMVFYHRLVKWIGPVMLCRAGLLSAVLPIQLLPTASLFTSLKLVPLVFVYAAMICRGPAKICALNSSMIIINQTAGKKDMGKVNGAAMSLQSAGRALGPLLSGTVWAISVSLHIPGQQFLGYVLVSLALLCVQFLYSGLVLSEKT